MASEYQSQPRQLEKQWNYTMILASVAISLLGAFTSTQLVCQARASSHFSGALVWTILGSLTFGFCSIWSLHQVAMLACGLDLPIGVDVTLTTLSAVIAVVFTFAALGSDLLWDRCKRKSRSRLHKHRRRRSRSASYNPITTRLKHRDSEEELLLHPQDNGDVQRDVDLELERARGHSTSPRQSVQADRAAGEESGAQVEAQSTPSALRVDPLLAMSLHKQFHPEHIKKPTRDTTEEEADLESENGVNSTTEGTDSAHGTATDDNSSRRSSGFAESSASILGMGNIMGTKFYAQSRNQAKNAFVLTWIALRSGITYKTIVKSFIWSLALTCMHYMGIFALNIPEGHVRLDPVLVILSWFVGWILCLVGCIIMFQMETHLTQQLLFSVVAVVGVAVKHFTGMRAVTFWSFAPPAENKGYPPGLAVAVATIAITTCLAANGLLAHAATISRNKLAEIVYTRRKLWTAVAQKESAEAAAAARSDFIASASHEIRTPLHQLQGYSDLLARTELTEEGRLLLFAMQHATKTLSLITSNVLDWSRLERNGETGSRPIALDMRVVCESIINLLPNKDDDMDAELFVVISPEVPHSLLLDEIYIHRILMNLLSNAIKFTSAGYVLLLVEMREDDIVATVSDTGSGIPPSFLPQLFEPFKQAQSLGAHRGTGLGLSIVKQLLEKMQGTINVESRYRDTPGVGNEKSGTVLTVKIPIQSGVDNCKAPPNPKAKPRVAIFHGGNLRTLDGLLVAWRTSGFEPIVVRQLADLSAPFQYVWADVPFLKHNPTVMQQLVRQEQWLVLVPVDSHNSLQEITGAAGAPNFIPVQKPFIWHSTMQQLAAAGQPGSRPSVDRTVRFSSKVDVMEEVDKETINSGQSSKTFTVLLVEDNRINQKLGAKMLTTLGYRVIIAEDGQEAIEKVIEHDNVIDAILMDQSMPRKDGLTATREIREMEEAGKLSKRRRPIIAVTAVVSSQAQMMCKLAGTDDFLAKPLSLARLKECLEGFLKW